MTSYEAKRLRIQSIQAALKLGNEHITDQTDVCTDVYYDRMERCWHAQFRYITNNWAMKSLGLGGVGSSPLQAVENLIANNPSRKPVQ